MMPTGRKKKGIPGIAKEARAVPPPRFPVLASKANPIPAWRGPASKSTNAAKAPKCRTAVAASTPSQFAGADRGFD